MATKDHCLSFKGKHGICVGDSTNNRYGNVNLNQKHQCLSVETVQSNHFSNKSKKVQNYEKTAACPQLSDVTHDTRRNKSPLSWKKSGHKLPSEYLNINTGSDKNEGKDSSKSKNASTLSLHIAAYENSIEAGSDSFERIITDKSNFTKNLKNVKLMNSSLPFNNPFEFPRQQTDDPTVPVIMQFTASQKLLNPNQGLGDSVTANAAMGSSVLPENFQIEGIQQERTMDSLPDSDEENALNDETFGGGSVEPIPEDLSAFAAITLEDMDDDDDNISDKQPSPKSSAPKRPNDFENWSGMNNAQMKAKMSDDYQERAYKSQQDAVRATQSLWGTSPNTAVSPRRNNYISTGGHNLAPSPPKPSSHTLRSVPGGALTLDEIEREQLMRTGAVHLGSSFPLTPGDKRTLMDVPVSNHVANAIPHASIVPHSAWVHPPIEENLGKSQKKTFVTAEELERKLLEEFQEKKAQQQQTNKPNPPSENEHGMNNMAGMFPPGANMPPMNPMQMAQMHQLFQWQQAMAAAVASGSTPPNVMPPGFPPLMSPFGPPNPAMFAAMMASRMPFPPPGMPPMGPPPSSFGMPPQMHQRSQAGTPSNALHPQGSSWPINSPINRNTASGCASPSGSTTSRRTRKEGMPSMRTITDFACDPYAGFMSKKEREWLIKIQLIQCLGTGDKYNDDYYYTCWKKNNTLEKRPDSWKQPKIKSKYYNLEETYPSVYNPPTFTGVLGKPSNATTSYPRQVLDIQPVEDDVESIVGSSSREVNKRKLRTILLSIENGFMWQLECDDLLRKVPTVNADEAGIMLNEIHTKLNAIYTTTMDETHIPTTMVITKGRRLVIRILALATSTLKIQIISNVFNTLRKYARKVSISPNNDFIQATLKTLFEVKENDLKEFFVKTDAERFQDTLVYSSFSQNLFTALLIACAKRSINLEAFAPGSSIIKFLQSDRKMYNGLGASFDEIFAAEDLSLLKTWLQKALLCSSGNVAGTFLVCLREKNY